MSRTRRSRRVAWVIGGGSGIGRATAQTLAGDGWHVVVTARTRHGILSTVDEITRGGGSALALDGDVSDNSSAAGLAAAAYAWKGRLDAVVHCAGINVPTRRWAEISPSDLTAIVATNQLSVAYTVLAALPLLRADGGGNVVVTSSWAGWRYLGRVGAAYAMSKSALAPLVETLNDEEGVHGIRATLLVPGEVATDLIRRRPDHPSEDELAAMLSPEDVAKTISIVLDLPASMCINEIVVSPTANRLYS